MKIIAESASNHQGDFSYLLELAKASKEAGVDFFSVQVLELDAFCDPTYKNRALVEEVVFSQAQWRDFFDYCRKINLAIIPCPADLSSLDFCLEEGFRLLKLHGTDLLNMPMLDRLALSEVKVLVETQLATERDINLALFRLGAERVECLLHGYSNYPTEDEELNLGALDYMRNTWKLPVGFADHSTDTTVVPMMAMAKEAKWLEKHITLSRNDRRYDWQPSLTPEEFAVMVSQIRHYQRCLGSGLKHPTSTEVGMRDVMYKRYIDSGGELKVVRADHGPDYYDYEYSKYDMDNIVTAVIARLKSTRLTRKVLRKFHNDGMVFDLYKYVDRAQSARKTILATSYLDSDNDLVAEAESRGIQVYQGHPMIVVDRLLDIAEQEKASAVFRVTGDMPFADPVLMDRMAKMRHDYDLDYVRVMNFPLGMSAELISTRYLQRLYQRMEDPGQSEYLGWFVMLDQETRKGCLKVEFEDRDLSQYSLTVDYQEDLDRCHRLLKAIGKTDMADIYLEDILCHLDILDIISTDTPIKLPNNITMPYSEFVQMQWDQGFNVVEKYIVNKH
ncbi:MAG: N-acetylneuraminate synthase family protein [Desulfobulbaceae bacterium]|nr:N-acetylneuraminate synthase family protein [Desulfobulbaceae bacterium]